MNSRSGEQETRKKWKKIRNIKSNLKIKDKRPLSREKIKNAENENIELFLKGNLTNKNEMGGKFKFRLKKMIIDHIPRKK